MLLTVHVEAGPMAGDHWLRDPAQGGGRVLGEGCHFFDLAAHLVGAEPTRVSASTPPNADPRDEIAAVVDFADGSVAAIVYTGRGDAAIGKERLTGSRGGGSFLLDDFTHLSLAADGRVVRHRRRQDKGHAALLDAFLAACRGHGASPADACAGTRATAMALAAIEAARARAPREILL
jgi:predicted dehydrogenase